MKQGIGQFIGTVVLVIFVGSFVYLVIRGIPTIKLTLSEFVRVVTGR